MLTLIEELFLLSLVEKKKGVEFSNSYPLRYGLSCSLITELFLLKKISLDEQKLVIVEDSSACGHSLLDKSLASIFKEDKPRKLIHWVNLFHCGKKCQMRLIENLLENGLLTQNENKFLWVIPNAGYHMPQNSSVKFQIKEKLRNIILGNCAAEDRELLLLGLMQCSNLLDHIFTRDEIKFAGLIVDETIKTNIQDTVIRNVFQEIKKTSEIAIAAAAST